MENEWIPFNEVDFSDENHKVYHVDTRDFDCLAVDEGYGTEIDIPALVKKYPGRFTHTPEEVLALLNRYLEESGGPVEWRYFQLDGSGKKYTQGWQMKYIRIHRVGSELVVCNKDSYALKKDILNNHVKQEHLHAH